MAAEYYRRSDYGAWLIVIASIAGLAVSIYNYNSADSGTAGTPGAFLVIVSTLLLLVAAFILGRDMGGTALRVVLATLGLLAILGTGFAAYLLESSTLVVAMAICLLGWLMRLIQLRAA